jgi:alcohol dehydrogenase class IV
MMMKPVTKLVPQPRRCCSPVPAARLAYAATIAEFGFRRVTIVTDAMLVKLGLVAPIRDALEKCGVAVADFRRHRSLTEPTA